jgi:hypothetical protein
MGFLWKDNVIYDELWNVEPAAAISAGDAAVVQDVFGFYIKDRESAGEEVCFVYRCRQVEADKAIGTGNDILAGDRLYYVVATGLVQPTPPAGGVFGVDYYFCGWAKKDAPASYTTVLMNFDGTRYNENL